MRWPVRLIDQRLELRPHARPVLLEQRLELLRRTELELVDLFLFQARLPEHRLNLLRIREVAVALPPGDELVRTALADRRPAGPHVFDALLARSFEQRLDHVRLVQDRAESALIEARDVDRLDRLVRLRERVERVEHRLADVAYERRARRLRLAEAAVVAGKQKRIRARVLLDDSVRELRSFLRPLAKREQLGHRQI